MGPTSRAVKDNIMDNQLDTPLPIGDNVEIVSHEFSGNTCKVLVRGNTPARLTDPDTKKAVYEYRHKIGASHMGLNKYENIGMEHTEDGPICTGYWYLLTSL